MTSNITETQPDLPLGLTDPVTKLERDKWALLDALKLAIRAMNNVPSFDTGIPAAMRADEEFRRTRTMSSYTLLPKLEAIVRKVERRQ